jgi:hypothetical protein
MRRRVNTVEYQQAFTTAGARLCVHCLQAVPDCAVASQARSFWLPGTH